MSPPSSMHISDLSATQSFEGAEEGPRIPPETN